MDQPPTKRRFSVWLRNALPILIPLLLLAILLGVVFLPLFVRPPDDETMRRLIGMSESQVEQVIGSPNNGISQDPLQTWWYYQWGYHHGFVVFKDGKCVSTFPPIPPRPDGESWD